MPSVYAAGFNAHQQLSLTGETDKRMQSDDIHSWTKIAEAQEEVQVLFAGWSSTVYDKIEFLGYLSGTRTIRHTIQLPHTAIKDTSNVRSIIGDHINGPRLLITQSGHLYSFDASSDTAQIQLLPRGDDSSPTVSQIAIAGNGRTAITMLQASGSRMIHVLEFADFKDFETWFAEPSAAEKSYTHHMLGGRVKALISAATCFTLLTEEGEVFSWGDARHSQCLGRSPDAETPASQRNVIAALGGIRIRKIDGRGWVFGALSEEGDLYLWGRDKPGGEDVVLGPFLSSGDQEVRLLEGEMFEDVKDFAVGNGHLLVANAAGELWVVGENCNGQLGIDDATLAPLRSWRKISNSESAEILNLAAGDLSSLLIVDHEFA